MITRELEHGEEWLFYRSMGIYLSFLPKLRTVLITTSTTKATTRPSPSPLGDAKPKKLNIRRTFITALQLAPLLLTCPHYL
jgi:hypothetical protein